MQHCRNARVESVDTMDTEEKSLLQNVSGGDIRHPG